MTDIFLSYTEKDRETARRVAALLESAGWTVWWDRRIPAGETWRSVLDKALQDMRCMIVLWSSKSIQSEWVCEEASEGRQQGKLVPVLIEAVRPPAGFREIQAADLTGWDGSGEFAGLRMLIGDLEVLLGKPGAGATTLAAKADAASAADANAGLGRPYDPADFKGALTSPRQRRLAWALGVTLLLTAGAAYLGLPAIDPAARPPAVTDTLRPVPERLPASAERAPPTPALPVVTDQHRDTGVAPEALTATPPVAVRQSSERPPAAKPAAAKDMASARCADLVARVQLGETLSENAQSMFRKECRQ